jgi:hypothetical protein
LEKIVRKEALKNVSPDNDPNASEASIVTGYIVGLLRARYPGNIRAELFRMLSEQEGVKLLGTTEDLAGRSGTAIAVESKPSHGQRLVLTFDQKTSQILSFAQQITDPASFVDKLFGESRRFDGMDKEQYLAQLEKVPMPYTYSQETFHYGWTNSLGKEPTEVN